MKRTSWKIDKAHKSQENSKTPKMHKAPPQGDNGWGEAHLPKRL